MGLGITRYESESVMIGDTTRVTLEECNYRRFGETVKLSVEGPRGSVTETSQAIILKREEVREAVERVLVRLGIGGKLSVGQGIVVELSRVKGNEAKFRFSDPGKPQSIGKKFLTTCNVKLKMRRQQHANKLGLNYLKLIPEHLVPYFVVIPNFAALNAGPERSRTSMRSIFFKFGEFIMI